MDTFFWKIKRATSLTLALYMSCSLLSLGWALSDNEEETFDSTSTSPVSVPHSGDPCAASFEERVQEDVRNPLMDLRIRFDNLTSPQKQEEAIGFYVEAKALMTTAQETLNDKNARKGKKKAQAEQKAEKLHQDADKLYAQSADLGYIPALLILARQEFEELEAKWNKAESAHEKASPSLATVGGDDQSFESHSNTFWNSWYLSEALGEKGQDIYWLEEAQQRGELFDYGLNFYNRHNLSLLMFSDDVFEKIENRKAPEPLSQEQLKEKKERAIRAIQGQINYLEGLKNKFSTLPNVEQAIRALIDALQNQTILDDYITVMKATFECLQQWEMSEEDLDLDYNIDNQIETQDEKIRSFILTTIKKQYVDKSIQFSLKDFQSIKSVVDSLLQLLPSEPFYNGEGSELLVLSRWFREAHDSLMTQKHSDLRSYLTILTESDRYLEKFEQIKPEKNCLDDPENIVYHSDILVAVRTQLARYHLHFVNRAYNPYRSLFISDTMPQTIVGFVRLCKEISSNIQGKKYTELRQRLSSEKSPFKLAGSQQKQDIWIHKNGHYIIRVKKSSQKQFTIGFLRQDPKGDLSILRDRTNEVFKASQMQIGNEKVFMMIPASWDKMGNPGWHQNTEQKQTKQLMEGAHFPYSDASSSSAASSPSAIAKGRQ